MGPSTRDPLSARRDARLGFVLRLLQGASALGVVAASPSWLLEEPVRSHGLGSMALVGGLFLAYTASAWLAARGLREAARRLLFSSWIAYLSCHLGSYRPGLGLEALDIGVANGFAALAIVGMVVLAEWRDAVRWIGALVVAYLAAGLLVAALRFEPGAARFLWLTTVAVSTLLLGALAACAHVFANDREAALAHSEQLRAAMEEALREANVANAVKNQFLANVSHELRTPLTGIVGYTELLLEAVAEGRPPGAAELGADLGQVRSAAVHLRGLIDDVLDLSKIEAGTLRLDPRPASIEGLAREAVATVRPLAAQRGNALSLRVIGVPEQVVVDAGRLRQVLLNLLSNAAKFTEGGQIAVLVEGAPDGLRFVVSDTGIGIPAGKLSAIFRPFEQVDPSTTRRFGGTGLGLAIARHLVEVMGGELGVTSRAGEGSTFTFTIPWSSVSASSPG